jgi:hypothetical protein
MEMDGRDDVQEGIGWQRPTAPHKLMKFGPDITCVGEGRFSMPEADCLWAFFKALGPQEIVGFNLNKLKNTMHEAYVEHIPEREDVNPDRVYRAHDYSDRFRLTSLGKLALPNKGHVVGALTVYYCTGKGCGGAGDETNCLRACGKQGPGQCGCGKEKSKGHGCAVRVKVIRTLQDIANQRVVVEIVGDHVPRGTLSVPPALNALKPDQKTKRGVEASVMDGTSTSTLACNILTAPLKRAAIAAGVELIPSSRFMIDPKMVGAGVKKSRADLKGGGGGQGDWKLTNDFVYNQLIQHGVVLYFSPLPGPEGLLVLSFDWALSLSLRMEFNLASTDCKHDTVEGCRCMFSTIRVSSPFHLVLHVLV